MLHKVRERVKRRVKGMSFSSHNKPRMPYLPGFDRPSPTTILLLVSLYAYKFEAQIKFEWDLTYKIYIIDQLF